MLVTETEPESTEQPKRLPWKWVVGTSLAVASLAVAIHFGLQAEKTKALEVRHLGDSDLSPWPADRGSVDGWKMVLIRVTNTGEVPIRSEDYENPLMVFYDREVVVTPNFGTTYAVGRVVASYPKDLPVVTTSVQDGLVIEPTLMNPGDYFELVVGHNPREPTTGPMVTARVSGIPKVELVGLTRAERPRRWIEPAPEDHERFPWERDPSMPVQR